VLLSLRRDRRINSAVLRIDMCDLESGLNDLNVGSNPEACCQIRITESG